ncbi:MAG: CPBP family intramembrane glutamic endopeptidase [Bryobacteraceae bacterium]
MRGQEEPVAFWDYTDLALFILLAGTTLLAVLLVTGPFGRAIPFGKPFQALTAQIVWYVLVFSALGLLLRIRYGAPFWKTLGWRFPFRGAGLALVAGPFLVVSLGLIGYIIRTPIIKPPFEQMLNNRPTVILFGLIAVVFGPLSEELAFRGFLLPLVMRSVGVAGGIVLTGFLFGALHAYEYDWSWRHSLLISIAGIVFGWVRYAARSTAASTFMHATFNLTQFVALVAQSEQGW